jgi:predicted secreted protein
MPSVETEVRVAPGDEFGVTLGEVPGSGHVWRCADVPDGLVLLDASYIDPDPSPAVGSSRQRRFRFRAERPGEFTLIFQLGRSWEPVPIQERVILVRAV